MWVYLTIDLFFLKKSKTLSAKRPRRIKHKEKPIEKDTIDKNELNWFELFDAWTKTVASIGPMQGVQLRVNNRPKIKDLIKVVPWEIVSLILFDSLFVKNVELILIIPKVFKAIKINRKPETIWKVVLYLLKNGIKEVDKNAMRKNSRHIPNTNPTDILKVFFLSLPPDK